MVGRGGDFPAARRSGSFDLQLVIPSLPAECPAHGYELIKILKESGMTCAWLFRQASPCRQPAHVKTHEILIDVDY
jgi:hypothetical protein